MSDDGLFVTQVDLGVCNVHLISGEDFIGQVWKHQDTYRIEKPVMPNIAQDPNTGQFRVGLLPVRPWMDKVDNITILAAHVIFVTPVPSRMLTAYKQFVSDLVIPPAGGLDALLSR